MVARRFVIRHNDTEFPVYCDTEDGHEVLKVLINSLNSVLPKDLKLKIVLEDEDRLVTEAFDVGDISERLRLVSISGGKEERSNLGDDFERSDEEFALQEEELALFLQQFRAGGNRKKFEAKIRPYVSRVLKYEDPVRQEAARKSVPVHEIEEQALVALAKEGKFKPSEAEVNHAFLLQLLFWFKQSFRWVNSPPCSNCSGQTRTIGMGSPNPAELKYGGTTVELYRCALCLNITRFPRYDDPVKLLETRRGRCGEWANCFTLYCRAFGYESRLVLDFTDHVWTECYTDFLGRWMHLDPCEGAYDNPLLYEKGWNKSLNYVIAVAKDGVYDVTKRYTRKWHEVLSRRNITTEAVALDVLSSITKVCRNRFSSEEITTLEERDKIEAEELEGQVHLLDDASLSLPGRQSGVIGWRIARSELGSTGSLSCSSCPARVCIDGHVKSIYHALTCFLCHAVDNELPKDGAVEVLKMLKSMLLDLKASPFKTRRSILNFNGSQFIETMMPCIEELLFAISLKGDLEKVGTLHVSLAGDPVQTSIALSVALDALDEIIDYLTGVIFMEKKIFLFPKSNRLCSGLVVASGEELPFGIATSAFDGTRISKWEEPNGAKGCWLLYKVCDDQMHELVSYDLTSANDAPERDPMDWIVEGSDDKGRSWKVLDKQRSQMFDKRFQRKSFEVHLVHKCNAFRFCFYAVRDHNATSRFQIGGIDLYTKFFIWNT